MRSIAIDLGASSGRMMLGQIKENRLFMEEIHRFENGPVVDDGRLHWDIQYIFKEIIIGLKKIANMNIKEHLSIGVASWGVDFAFLDNADRLIKNPIHYRDAAKNNTRELIDAIGKERLYNMVGIQFMEINTLNRLYLMTKEEPEILKRAKTMLYISDLIVFMLTGAKMNEYTMASTSSLLDLKTKTYNKELLKYLGISETLFPPIAHPGTNAGQLKPSIKELTGIKDCKVILIASHDTASAVAGAPLDGKNSAFLSSGTWSLLGKIIETPVVNAKALEYNFTNEAALNGSIRFLKNISGLWLMQELKKDLDEKDQSLSFDDIDRLIEKAHSSDVYIDPNDEIFAEPSDMTAKINQYLCQTGQKQIEDIGSIGRCILESLALTTKKHFIELEDVLNHKIDNMHIIGGGVKNHILLDFTANAIGKEIIAGPVEATAIGNILAQQHFCNNIDLSSIPKLIEKSFELVHVSPKDQCIWDDKYRHYLQVIGQKRTKVVHT
jgi:rhamnulokinase